MGRVLLNSSGLLNFAPRALSRASSLLESIKFAVFAVSFKNDSNKSLVLGT